MNNLVKYIYFRESLWQSVASDASSAAFLTSSFYLNYRFIGNNSLLNAVLLIMFMLFIVSEAKNKMITYTDKAKLIKDLQDNKL